ncbi:hypothetical protein IQ06DRAFT_351485 [Phaeosphaeriaceae sp. SRC1lsM3a]|nr:hypothetical protein IQ06DRAFT_351485 [Stagonospora sp. SRC1lsM3a]
MYRQINPGTPPPWNEVRYDSDIEMTLDEVQDEPTETEVMVTVLQDREQGRKDHDPMEHDIISNVNENRIIIAIDFGTTFSSVAYTTLPKGTPPDDIGLRHIRCIGNYPGYEPVPGAPIDFRHDVPSELWYDDGAEQDRGSHETNPNDGEDDTSHLSSSDEDDSENERSQSEEDDGPESRAGNRGQAPRLRPTTQYWGYEVQQKLNTTNIHSDEAQPIARFKLCLDPKQATGTVCTQTSVKLKSLIQRQIIAKEEDIFADYLTHLLDHTKHQLLGSKALCQNMLVQFVLCVPAKWPIHGCRTMQLALERAIAKTGMTKWAIDGAHDMFMISEPEAAAECILAEAKSELFRNETIVILDAGGGTVDAVTYKCKKSDPLRLSAEVVPPDSALDGASFINEKFQAKILQKLANEQYLIGNGKTLKSIAQAKTTVFENYQKRIIDVTTKKPTKPVTVYIDNLRESKNKKLLTNNIPLKWKTMKFFFEQSLQGVKKVLVSQLELAESREHRVKMVALTGGFGQSPSLQSFLREYLQERRNIDNEEIELIVPPVGSTAVARGAVLRALNKRFGPDRITQCSYGFLRSEVHEPTIFEAHKKQRCRIDKNDGEKYIDRTINWVIQKGDIVGHMQIFSFDMCHTFAVTKKKLLCAEELWMSDFNHPSHYRNTHAENNGAVPIGTIETDLTFLIDEGHIQPQSPSQYSTYAGSRRKFWQAHYEILMVVEGRSIRFEARWPAKDDWRPTDGPQRVLATKMVGIASAFLPGTA